MNEALVEAALLVAKRTRQLEEARTALAELKAQHAGHKPTEPKSTTS